MPATRPSRRWAAAAACAALAAGTAPAAAAVARHEVHVIGAHNRVLARFADAKCSVNRRHSTWFSAVSHSLNGGRWTLKVSFGDFHGFDNQKHTYVLTVGHKADPWVSVFAPSGTAYSNLNPPVEPTFGYGQVVFAGTDASHPNRHNHGQLMGVGFSPAYDRRGTDAVTFTGVVTCHYPKKKRSRH